MKLREKTKVRERDCIGISSLQQVKIVCLPVALFRVVLRGGGCWGRGVPGELNLFVKKPPPPSFATNVTKNPLKLSKNKMKRVSVPLVRPCLNAEMGRIGRSSYLPLSFFIGHF